MSVNWNAVTAIATAVIAIGTVEQFPIWVTPVPIPTVEIRIPPAANAQTGFDSYGGGGQGFDSGGDFFGGGGCECGTTTEQAQAKRNPKQAAKKPPAQIAMGYGTINSGGYGTANGTSDSGGYGTVNPSNTSKDFSYSPDTNYSYSPDTYVVTATPQYDYIDTATPTR